MTDMRHYLDLLDGPSDEAGPTNMGSGMDPTYDEFGATVPAPRPPAVPMASVAEPAVTTVTMGDADPMGLDAEQGDPVRDMCKRLLAKVAHHAKELAPILLQGDAEIEPWMQDKLSQAAEAMVSVSEYLTLDADDILILMAEGKGRAVKVLETRKAAMASRKRK